MNEQTIHHKNRAIGPGALGAIAVGLVVIIAVIIWKLSNSPSRENHAPPSTTLVTAPAAVMEFEKYVRDNRAEEAMATDHAYTSNGLRRLAAALESLCDRDGVNNAEIKQQLAQLRSQADNIQADPQATSHAADIRAAFTTATDLMTTLQQQRYPDLVAQMVQARRVAETIDPAQLTLAQKAQVGAFFAHASEVLRTMAQSPI